MSRGGVEDTAGLAVYRATTAGQLGITGAHSVSGSAGLDPHSVSAVVDGVAASIGVGVSVIRMATASTTPAPHHTLRPFQARGDCIVLVSRVGPVVPLPWYPLNPDDQQHSSDSTCLGSDLRLLKPDAVR
jgi:hypothetical protein